MLALFASSELALRAPGVAQPRDAIGRRALLGAAALTAAPLASFALAPEERAVEAATGYMKAVSECENDACAALLTPKLTVANGGMKSAKIVVSGPASDKLPGKGDYVDTVWIANARGGVMNAEEFKPIGKGIKAAASTDSTPIRPTVELRVDKGNTVVPFIHLNSGATFKGAPVEL